MPASLNKNECFENSKDAYAMYNEAEISQKLEEYKNIKKKGKQKYTKILPKGALKHDYDFKPPKLVSSGREALFNDDLYKIPKIVEQKKEFVPIREIREKERQKQRTPFVFNRLMNASVFSPSINSYQSNMKKEFPSVYIH